ncbi:MAG: hypothetical protein JSW23_05455, partial [Planctomycetota bacterium]
FTGVFDGNGHTISNFTYDSNGINRIGLFGYINDPNAEIKSLGLIDPNINAGSGGPMAGYLYRGNITECYVEGGSISGGPYIGGLVGLCEFYGTIEGCYVTGDVSGSDEVGGLVGHNEGRVSNCYATGAVSGDDMVGGLVGKHRWQMWNSYSTGNVSGTATKVGGLVGYCAMPTTDVISSYWNTETSGQLSSAGGTGKTTAEMKDPNTYIGWWCDLVWTIDSGVDYPHLVWEQMAGDIISRPTGFYGGGNGTESDPYLIYTAEQLNAIGIIHCDADKHFKLMSDIDLSSFSGSEFNFIGSNPLPFVGVFDGNGHTISNFSYVSTGDFGGFFPYVGDNAEIRNLGLLNPNVDAGSGKSVGSVIGYLHGGGTVNRCYVEGGTVIGNDNVGGLVGCNGWEEGGEGVGTKTKRY